VGSSTVKRIASEAIHTDRRRRLGKAKNNMLASASPPPLSPTNREDGCLRLAVVAPTVEMVTVTVCAAVPEILTEAGIEQVGA
jgi:hypothetical protein